MTSSGSMKTEEETNKMKLDEDAGGNRRVL
jgi:hypothetical protein